MTTVHGENIFPIEVDGTFDDCQNIVKSILVDREFSRRIFYCSSKFNKLV